MSLELAAKQLAARGRGGDSVLMHMAPDEAKGLQALAMAHGGSLTINPDTGLPEANFLKSILPLAIGFALGPAGFGAMSALGAGATVGGIEAARTGDLTRGLLAGLGAYGGAGIGEGLMAAGGAKGASAAGATKVGATEVAKAGGTGAVKAGATPSIVPSSARAVPSSARVVPELGIFDTAAGVPGAVPVQAQSAAGAGQLSAGLSAASKEPMAFLAANKAPLISGGIGVLGTQTMYEQKEAERRMREAMEGKEYTPEELEAYRRRHLYETDYTGGTPLYEGAPVTSERLYFTPRRAQTVGLAAMAEGGTTKVSQDVRTPPALVERRQQQQEIADQVRKYQTPATYPTTGFSPQLSGASRQAYEYLMGRAPSLPSPPVTSEGALNPRPSQTLAATTAPSPIKYTQNIPTGIGYANADYLNQALTTGTVVGIPTEHMENVKRELDLLSAQGRLPGFIADPTRQGGGYDNVRRRINRTAHGGEIKLKDGGPVGLENGGFVVPADVVSALGNGSSSAGLEVLANRIGAKPIRGPGDGMSDSIRTSIEGKRPAAIARDEAYVPPDRVAKAGGADKLYGMMDRVRKKAHGKTTQQRKVNPRKLVP